MYFDTDVLVHYFVNYDPAKHQQARQVVQQAVLDRTFCISLLCVQETSFAMTKLQQPLVDINAAVSQLLLTNPTGYDLANFRRASEIAQHIGFKNINDCLHTSIAEAYNCTELITYNRKEFDRIRTLTNLKITFLKIDE
ncbi:type II toxin-antitoxin system VapC family toxin [Spirosoma aerolatum]|uniref:type II toxin-antitoxin system VapC family toxin n=1 Tax=Spirosoma aerolatum TaxID=1211326 RepID=UPI0009AF031A|nr:PIN domain-containing protein [Spirosoma aerolatum]